MSGICANADWAPWPTPRAHALSDASATWHWIVYATSESEPAEHCAPCATAAEDAEVARRVAQDPNAFDQLFDRYYPLIFNYCLRRTGQQEAAEDVTSEVFCRALGELLRGRVPRDVRPYFYRMARNAIVDRHRRSMRWSQRITDWWHVMSTHSEATPLAPGHEQDPADKARALALALPQAYREPLLLRVDEDLSPGEIAGVLGLSHTAVRQRLSRACAMIREQLAS